jgi:hypothetical protein
MLCGNVSRNIFRHIGREQAEAFPGQELCGITGADRVRNAQTGGVFLRDAGKYTLAAGALDPNTNPGEFLLERLAHLLRKLKICRCVSSEFAVFRRCSDQAWRDALRRWSGGAHRRGIHKRQRGGGF